MRFSLLKSLPLLLLLLMIEYLCFYHLVTHHIATNYPNGIDQANYLYASYALYQHIQTLGWQKAFSLYHLLPTTFLFIVQAALFFLVFQASRLAALSINFIYFAILQVVGYYTVQHLTRHAALCVLFLGMLLATEHFFQFGGAVDFRMDFIACCLYGILTCTILNSGIFLQRRATIIGALVAALLITMRFLTVAYVAGMTVGMLLTYVYLKDRRRLKNIVLFAALVASITLPILWLHRDLLYSYYVVGHLVGAEKLFRAQMVGVETTMDALLYYPITFSHFDFGLLMQRMLFFVIGVSLVLIGYASPQLSTFVKRQSYKDELWFLLLSILVPLVILTLDQSKATIPPSIFLVPSLLFIVWIYTPLYEKLKAWIPTRPNVISHTLISAFFITGFLHFVYQSDQKNAVTDYQDTPLINAMLVELGDKAYTAHIQYVHATADIYTDFLAALPAYYFEQRGVLLPFTCKFGCGSQTFVESEKTVLNAVAKSTLFMTSPDPYKPNRFYSFELAIEPFRPLLKQVASKHLSLIASYAINAAHYQIYLAPSDDRIH